MSIETVCRWSLLSVLPILLGADAVKPAATKNAPPPPAEIRNLADFGPIDTPAALEATFDKAVREMRTRGGILVVPRPLPAPLKRPALQGLARTPAPPEETRQWTVGPGVTVLAPDRQASWLEVPPLAGLKVVRDFRLDDGQSAPHWGTHPMLTLENNQVYGSLSYMDWLQADVERGRDRRFYVPTVRGLVRGDKECPWTKAVVGRWFAVATRSEQTPKGSYRWYQITSLVENPDGTKDIAIQRFWWGAKEAGSPLLYRRENYTWDGHERPLEYIIAPGTYVNDVSRAVPGGDRGGQRLLGLAPYGDQGTDFDFAAGDAVEQAIGPDPFKPEAFRCWTWEDVPGMYPSAIFDISNAGQTSRYAVLSLHGGSKLAEEMAARYDQRPPWDNVFVFDQVAAVGINCQADFTDAAILFAQSGREQAIRWNYGAAEGRPPQRASLTVSRTSGELSFEGHGVRTNGPVTAVAGLSADATPARNLRGKNLAVAEKSTSLRVRFAVPEADGDYAVFVEQSWLSNRAISEKGPEGFTVTFAAPAPAEAKLDWMIVR